MTEIIAMALNHPESALNHSLSFLNLMLGTNISQQRSGAQLGNLLLFTWYTEKSVRAKNGNGLKNKINLLDVVSKT